MDENQTVSADLSIADLKSDLDFAQNKLQVSEQKIMHLELSLLQSRDFAIGAVAQTGEARVDRDKLKDQLKDANVHLKSHSSHIARLEEAMVELNRVSALHRARIAELELVYRSASWKIGRFMMTPVRILRKITR